MMGTVIDRVSDTSVLVFQISQQLITRFVDLDVQDDYNPSESKTIKHSQYLIRKVNRYVTDLHEEQSLELELERSLKGPSRPNFKFVLKNVTVAVWLMISMRTGEGN